MAEDCKTLQARAKGKKRAKKSAITAAPKSSDDPAKTAGLVGCLKLCIGCRVMLRRNIDTQRGLTNGAIGTVTNFKQCSNKIDAVVIKFDSSPSEETVIEKVTARFFINQEFTCTRKQFPLILAYGITCHKSQGLSLDVVLADLGGDVFEPGMAYVSLSRVRRLQNLYLFDFDAAQICCNALAYNQYQ
uniref:ATP-dependent DNA helicase n=1 Tax=Plectus sambesii TaxID=2011161 RepID=A0A914W5Y6_9BILA